MARTQRVWRALLPRLPRGKKPAPVPVFIRTRGSAVVALTRPLKAGGLRRLACPLYYRNLVPALAAGREFSEKRLNGWLLVLAAKRVPHVFTPGRVPRIYVPVLYERLALSEITAFEQERPPAPLVIPPQKSALGVVLLFVCLAVWHFCWPEVVRRLLAGAGAVYAGGNDLARFGLDIAATRWQHQWWRTVTALTLHADAAHLASNVLFGVFFFIPLFRRTGAGLGILLVFLCGAAGNVANVLSRTEWAVSIGFSTAFFAGIGILSAFVAGDGLAGVRQRIMGARQGSNPAWQAMVPLGAGLALLAMLGMSGERTDYAAHIWGLACGVVGGSLCYPCESWLRRQSRVVRIRFQYGCGILTVALLLGGWAAALFSTGLIR